MAERLTNNKGRLRFLAGTAVCLLFIPFLILILWANFSECRHPLEGISFSRVICDRKGIPMRIGLTPDQKYRIRTHLEDIPPDAIRSVIRYEDRRFWKHCGVSVPSMLRAAFMMLKGGRVMGGSTLTMQVARLSQGLRTGSLYDKLLQIAWALKLECHFTKAEILECYFNLAPYGGNVEGLGAAARIYFHKEPSRLSASESMALMLVPQNPGARRPSQNNVQLTSAAARLMHEWTGETEYAPLRIYGTADLPFNCPHVSSEMLARNDVPDRTETTIDMKLQKLLERQIAQFSARSKGMGLANASALLVHWPTREIRALVGSADFKNERISGQIDGTLARRSPGSTLKPAIYALALDQGLIHPKTLLADMPRSFSGYDPENFDNAFRGPLHADEALRLSRNIPALTLAAKLAPPGLYGFLQNAGFRFEKSEEHYGLSLVLGGAEVTMRELAALYAAFPNRGVWQPLALTKEESMAPALQKQLFSPEAAFITLDMLVSDSPNLRVRSNGKTLPLRIKTGTSNGYRDAWTAGILGPYVLVVWIGNFDNSSNPLLVGGRTALPLYCETAQSIAAAEPMQDTLAIPSWNLNVEKIEACESTGDADASLCGGRTVQAWFIPGISPVKPTGILQTILIDRETGLRACMPEEGKTEEITWEFWPSDLKKQFLRAGIRKPDPPDFLPECGAEKINAGNPPPVITLPKHGLIYHVSLRSGSDKPLALMAHAASGVRTLYWFADGMFLGQSAPGESLTHVFAPGDYLIRVTDDAGKTAVRRLRVRAAQ